MSAIKVTGTLGRNAEARFTPDGTAWLCIEIHQGHNAVAARRRYDNSAASAIVVRNLAHHLRQGSRVTVHAEHYEIEMRPTPHLVLTDVSSIEALAFTTQPTREAA